MKPSWPGFAPNTQQASASTPSLLGRSFRPSAQELPESRSGQPVFCVLKWGGLGSVLTTLPLLRALKTHPLDPAVIYITDAGHLQLVERLGVVDRALGVRWRPASAWLRDTLVVVQTLRRARPLLFFDLQIHTRRRWSALTAWLSGARVRLGLARSRDNLRSRVFHRLTYANPFAPVHELYLQMARTLPGLQPASPGSAAITLRPEDRREAASLLRNWQAGEDKLLVVNPNASGTALERRWPLGRFAAAVLRLMAHFRGLKVALIGSSAEAEYVERLRRMIGEAPGNVRNMAGRTTLGGLLGLLERADCLLTNDSGPLHLGFALGTPTVGLFGPAHPDHYARLGRPDRTIIFYRPLVCSPCVHHVNSPPCGGNNRCMQLIEPQEVVAACAFFLAAGRESSRAAMDRWRFSPYPGVLDHVAGAPGSRAPCG